MNACTNTVKIDGNLYETLKSNWEFKQDGDLALFWRVLIAVFLLASGVVIKIAITDSIFTIEPIFAIFLAVWFLIMLCVFIPILFYWKKFKRDYNSLLDILSKSKTKNIFSSYGDIITETSIILNEEIKKAFGIGNGVGGLNVLNLQPVSEIYTILEKFLLSDGTFEEFCNAVLANVVKHD